MSQSGGSGCLFRHLGHRSHLTAVELRQGAGESLLSPGLGSGVNCPCPELGGGATFPLPAGVSYQQYSEERGGVGKAGRCDLA